MSPARLTDFLRYLARPPSGAAVQDELLLERFARDRDEAAFRALLARHGPLVWGLCRRLVHNAQDAEDAFQATFLVLARKAHAIRKRAALRSWLYGVSVRIARQVRKEAEDRQRHERNGLDLRSFGSPEAERVTDSEVRLHGEVTRLPSRYRLPLILHYFEGKSREEIAAELGWTAGTVKGRLERARAMLRARLAPAALVALGPLAAPAPAALIRSTARLAALVPAGNLALSGLLTTRVLALVEGTVQAMVVAKVKSAGAVVLLLGALGAGAVGGGVVWKQISEHRPQPELAEAARLPAERPRGAAQPAAQDAEAAKDVSQAEQDRLRNRENLERVLKVAHAMQKDLDEGKKRLEEFMQQNAALLVEEPPESMGEVAASLERLRTRHVEIDTELEFLKRPENAKLDPRTLILLARRTGGSKGMAAPEELKNTAPVEFVSLYEASLKLEQQLVQAQVAAADKRYRELMERKQAVAVALRKEKDLREDLARVERLHLPLFQYVTQAQLSLEPGKP